MARATKTPNTARKQTNRKTGQVCPKCGEPAHKTGNKIKCEACNETFTARTLRLDVTEDRTGKPAHREKKVGYFDQKGERVEKDFFQEHWSEAKQKWIRGIPKDFEIYLWHVRKLLLAPKEDWIVFTEGIKCAESMEKLEYTATTNLFGGRAWHSEWYNEDLRDRRVAFFCDRDETGEKGREKIATGLHGITAETRLIFLDGDLPEKTDVTNLIEDHKWERKNFDDLIDKTPAFVPKETGSRLITVTLSDVQAVPVQWHWLYRYALGHVALLVGDPGAGKTFLSLDMAARTSIGAEWPDWKNLPEGANCAPKGRTLILSCEDGLADTVRPRLDAMGADCTKIIVIQGVYHKAEKEQAEKEQADFPAQDEVLSSDLFDLSCDLEYLEKKIIQLGDVKLIIIDPISAYYGSRPNANTNPAIRRVLTALGMVAERHHVCIIGISHLRKSGADIAQYRVSGSIGQIAAARTSWLIHADKDDTDRRLFVSLKNNLVKEPSGLAFRITDDPRIEYESGIITESADELFEADSEQGPRVKEAIEFLDHIFAKDESLSAIDVGDKARKQGISARTLRRATKKMGLVKKKYPYEWRWEKADESD